MAIRRKRVSIRDVAQHVGVDPSTVSLALNGSPRVADSTRARVLRAARDLGYRPNALAQALRRGSTRSVGLLAASLDIPFFVDLLKAQERWLVAHHFSTLFANLACDPAKEDRILNEMRARRVDGICISYPSAHGLPLYQEVNASGIRLSFYVEKHNLAWVEGCNASIAVCDLSRGCLALIQHLYELGHRRIAYLGFVTDRELDYRQAMHELGLDVRQDWIIDTGALKGGIEEGCEKLMELSPLPTAVFTQSDEWAARLINELVRRGIRVPQDVSVVGVNNNPIGELVRVPLTTLALPTQQIGRWMAECITDGAEDRRDSDGVRFFPTEIIVRESTAEPKT